MAINFFRNVASSLVRPAAPKEQSIDQKVEALLLKAQPNQDEAETLHALDTNANETLLELEQRKVLAEQAEAIAQVFDLVEEKLESAHASLDAITKRQLIAENAVKEKRERLERRLAELKNPTKVVEQQAPIQTPQAPKPVQARQQKPVVPANKTCIVCGALSPVGVTCHVCLSDNLPTTAAEVEVQQEIVVLPEQSAL